jgi:hypothetical protein
MTARSEVLEAVKRLQEAHRFGRRIQREQGWHAKQGNSTIEARAAALGLNPDNYRRLRLFADPDAGYSKQELAELCKLCKDHQQPVTLMTVGRLLKIHDKRERRRLQRRAIEDGWTLNDLDVELARLYGRRRWAGRKPKVPQDVAEALMQLDSLCLKWTRWYTQIAEGAEGDSPVALADLPDAVAKPLARATRAVRQVQEVVANYLAESRSGRRSRSRSS